MSGSVSSFWIVAGSVVFSAFIWFLVLALAALASGWRCLARTFALSGPTPEAVERFVTARVGKVDYGSVLHAVDADLGLVLFPVWLFRPFHPPLLIPWTEMDAVPGGTAWLRLEFPAVPGGRLVAYGRRRARAAARRPGSLCGERR
jgi:hypothetical protein